MCGLWCPGTVEVAECAAQHACPAPSHLRTQNRTDVAGHRGGKRSRLGLSPYRPRLLQTPRSESKASSVGHWLSCARPHHLRAAAPLRAEGPWRRDAGTAATPARGDGPAVTRPRMPPSRIFPSAPSPLTTPSSRSSKPRPRRCPAARRSQLADAQEALAALLARVRHRQLGFCRKRQYVPRSEARDGAGIEACGAHASHHFTPMDTGSQAHKPSARLTTPPRHALSQDGGPEPLLIFCWKQIRMPKPTRQLTITW